MCFSVLRWASVCWPLFKCLLISHRINPLYGFFRSVVRLAEAFYYHTRLFITLNHFNKDVLPMRQSEVVGRKRTRWPFSTLIPILRTKRRSVLWMSFVVVMAFVTDEFISFTYSATGVWCDVAAAIEAVQCLMGILYIASFFFIVQPNKMIVKLTRRRMYSLAEN